MAGNAQHSHAMLGKWDGQAHGDVAERSGVQEQTPLALVCGAAINGRVGSIDRTKEDGRSASETVASARGGERRPMCAPEMRTEQQQQQQ